MIDREALSLRYARVRARTDALAAPLSPEDAMVQSMPDASPAKWHLAHTTWFFEEFVLAPHEPGHRWPDERWRVLFNSYYEAVGPRHARPARGLLSRPPLDEVRAWRSRVDARVLELLPSLGGAALEAVSLGTHHEEQHQELLLTDVQHALSGSELRPAYTDRPLAASPAGSAAPLAWTSFDEAVVDLGHAGDGFAFDNETPRHRALVGPFRLASRLVTNGEYRAFVDDGGYDRAELWLADGWAAAKSGAWRGPLYWDDAGEHAFGMRGMQPLDPALPVAHVSHYEADAFARWAGARLPTEPEWERAAQGRAVEGNFVDSGRLATSPARGEGMAQLFGDVWEWTGSAYLPYPRFRPLEGALGEYNGKFMSGQMVLRGGSCFSPREHLRASYRNFFPPHARWQVSGVRLARDA
ncbi:MAG TPA: ergothioneine biosynthesis protein EgtB [Polyangiaceae bacterium]